MFSLVILSILVIVVVLNLILLSKRRSGDPAAALPGRLDAILRGQESLESRLREEMARSQQREGEENRALREEVCASLQAAAARSQWDAQNLREETTKLLAQFQNSVINATG